MGCTPSKGNKIAVQSAQTPRGAPPNFKASNPPVTPPINTSKANKENANPLDFKRPLPAIGGAGDQSQLGMKRPSLSTVPELGEDPEIPAWMKPDMKAIVSDAKSGEHNKEVKHTQSSVAFTFTFGGEAPARAPGRLPPLIREKTMKKETDENDLKNSLMKRQQEVDNRRQSELDSIKKNKKRRKVKLKRATSEVANSENENGSESLATASIVPPLDIPSSSDKNGSPTSGENNQSSQSKQPTSQQPETTTLNNGAIMSNSTTEENRLDPRNGSAHHDSTYGSGDEAGVDTNATRVIDPLRRFSKRRKNVASKIGLDADDEFYSGEEDVNPIETANFFED